MRHVLASTLLGAVFIAAAFLLLRGGLETAHPPSQRNAAAADTSPPQPAAEVVHHPLGDDEASPPASPERAEAASGVSIRLRFEGDYVRTGEVFALPLDSRRKALLTAADGLPASVLRRDALRLKADGNGLFALPASQDSWFVAARVRGSAPAGLWLEGVGEATVTLELPPESILRGRVVSLYADDPLDDVVVRARRFFEHPSEAGSDEGRVAAMFFESEARPDAQGRFFLHGLGMGRVDVEAVGTGRTARPSEEDVVLPREKELVLRLVEGFLVRGRVLAEEDDAPIPWALVEQVSTFNEYADEVLSRTRCDAEGRFHLLCLATGEEVALRIGARGFATKLWTGDADVLRAGGEVKVELGRGCSSTGQVKSSLGRPFALECWVEARRHGQRFWARQALCDADGRFELTGLVPGGAYDLYVYTEDHYHVLLENVVPCGDALRIEMPAAPRIVGTVEDAEGRPIPGASVRVVEEDGYGNPLFERRFESDGEGRYEAFVPGEGSYRLEVWSAGFAPRRFAPLPVSGDEDVEVPLDIVLDRGRPLRGRVVDKESGAPIVGAGVSLADTTISGKVRGAAPLGPATRTDGEGRFDLAAYPTATRPPILVEAEGYARRVIRPRADGVEQTVELSRAAVVTVEVLDEAGKAFSEFWLYTWAGNGDSTYHHCEHGGRLTVEGLEPGLWNFEVIVSPPGVASLENRSQQWEVTLQPGDRRTLSYRFGSGRVRGVLRGAAVRAALEERRRIFVHARPVGGRGRTGRVSVTADRGRYELRGLRPGPYWIVAESGARDEGFHQERLVDVPASGVAQVDFEVGGGGLVGVVSLDDGSPIPEAQVEAVPLLQESDRPSPRGVRARTRTGPEGRFLLQGLHPGRYGVTVTASGLERNARTVVLPEGEDDARVEVAFTLRPEGILEVEVSSRAGRPLSSATLSLRSRLLPDLLSFPPTKVSALPATWRFSALPEETLLLRAEAEGHFPEEREVVVPSAENSTIAVSLRRLGALRVRVKRFEGGAASGWPVSVVDEETGTDVASWLGVRGVESSTGSLVTDERGELVLRGLPEGRYRLSAGGAPEHAVVVPGAEPAEASLLAGG